MALKLQFIIFSTIFIARILGQHLEDKRCRCICPSPSEVLNNSFNSNRRLFIANVPPSKCNCVEVILPHIGEEIKGYEHLYCPRCECKYESRNTTVIMVVVVFLVWIIALLVVYMGFLKCLDPLIKKKKAKFYREQGSDEARNLLKQGDDLED